MDVVDTKKLDTAILYLQRITEGKNPVNNMPVEDDAVINNPNVVRCMFFVKEVLEELKKNDGYIGRKPRKNMDETKMEYPLEALKSFNYVGDKSITQFLDQLYGLVDMKKYKKLSARLFTSWLKEKGYLTETKEKGSNRTVTYVTEKGIELGIKSEMRRDHGGRAFIYILYGQKAQEFLVQNITEILGEESLN